MNFAEQKRLVMPTQEVIVSGALATVISNHGNDPVSVKSNFDSLLSEVESKAHMTYLSHEKQFGAKVLRTFSEQLISDYGIDNINGLIGELENHFTSFDKFFLSLAQSRKARAGKTFEYIHNNLFKLLGYPFDEQQVINGKPDFVMPSVAHFRQNPMDCIIFTAKRTLRERWRQIVTEGTRGLGFFLATIDSKLTKQQLEEMKDHRIYIVVPESLKNEKYSNFSNVLSFQRFFRDHLDPALTRWRKNGVISA